MTLQIQDRFPTLPAHMPASLEEVRTLMRLAFEEGDLGGAVKAYENVASQLDDVPGGAPFASDCRRFAGTLGARARRVRDDLSSLGWVAKA